MSQTDDIQLLPAHKLLDKLRSKNNELLQRALRKIQNTLSEVAKGAKDLPTRIIIYEMLNQQSMTVLEDKVRRAGYTVKVTKQNGVIKPKDDDYIEIVVDLPVQR